MKICRINGQLLLLMLAEKLIAIGCKIVQANTDGLFVLRPKDKEVEFQNICREWEKLTKLTLEEDRFEAMYQYAINDYLAVKEGYSETKDPKLLKKKGMFIDEVKLGKGMDAMIIPESVNKCLVDKVPVEETIRNCIDIKDFLMTQRVNKKFSVEYNDKNIQRINRFYASTNGCYLYKHNNEGKYLNILTKSGITILNKLDDIPISERNINYRYYETEAAKIIQDFKTVELSLW